LIEVDTHVHTVLSGHAFSTLTESIKVAKEKGLKGIVITEHGPEVPGGAPYFIPFIIKNWPDYMEGLRVYKSIEANILGSSGRLDIPRKYLEMLDFVIAGLHFVPVEDFCEKNTTEAYIAAYEDKLVDAIAHPDNAKYPADFEEVVKAAKRNDKLVELNNQSINMREGGKENIPLIMKLCIKYDVRIVVASDAHVCYNVGEFSVAKEILKEINFPHELILNSSIDKFEEYIKQRAKRLTNSKA
jgi:putative hydrolase